MKRLKVLEAIMRWKGYPDIVRIPVFLGTAYLIYILLFGEQAAGKNPGLSMMWILWWSMQPVVFILFGRFWCGICPFSTAGEIMKKIAGNEIHPPLMLKKYGVWFAYFFFIVILIIEAMVHMSNSTSASGILLFTIFIMAMISGAFFKKRTWCRYLCPLGVGGGVFSRLRLFGIRPEMSICNDCKDYRCLVGNGDIKGCPMGLCAKKHDMDADCISCGTCLRICPSDSPRITLRPSSKVLIDSVKMRPAESVFASSYIGFAIAMYLVKDHIYTFNILGNQYAQWNTFLTIAGFTVFSLLIFYGFSYLVRPFSRHSRHYNFMFFGFFLIPYAFFGLLNLTFIREILLNGRIFLLHTAQLLGWPMNSFAVHPLVNTEVRHLVQALLLLAGFVLSVLLCYTELRKILVPGDRRKSIAVYAAFLGIMTIITLMIILQGVQVR